MAVGVFGLQVAYKLKRTELLSLDDTHGWFGGGQFATEPTTASRVERIDFSNDSVTASIRSPLTVDRYVLAATGNSNYGWFGGGFSAATAVIATVDRIDFSNDSTTASVRGSLSAARYTAATANSNYGWFGAGYNGAGVSTVDRIDFSNDSPTASVRGPLSRARYTLGATGNSNYGWFVGGFDGLNIVYISFVDRIDFSNDSTTALPRGPLSQARTIMSRATGNSNYGWFGGGNTPSPAAVSTVDRIDFSNDSVSASVRGPLSLARRDSAATGNSNYGWFGGGVSPTTTISTVDRIDFSNDSVTTSVRGPLSLVRRSLASTSGQAKSSSIRLQKTGNFGWFGGGSTPNPGLPPINYSTVDRIDFSNDSLTASVRGPLSLARRTPTATGNSNYGWFGGGNISTPTTFIVYSTVDRIDFSNDSATASVRGPLSLARQGSGAIGNSNYGWFGGGYFPGPGAPASTVDRINFSNDSSTASVRGPLSSPLRGGFGATGNSNYGWFGGGSVIIPTISTVDRIDFSNDSSTTSPRGPLSLARSNLAATANSNYGWFGGGVNSTPAKVSTVDRIDFSNDLSTASVRGPLSSVRYIMGATGNSNYGWFGGGFFPASFSTVNRIDFSNDSSTASVRGPLSLARWSPAATSNTPIG